VQLVPAAARLHMLNAITAVAVANARPKVGAVSATAAMVAK
jgi:hypothetical protein